MRCWSQLSFDIFLRFTHCSKSSFFVQKFNFDFPRKLPIFLGWKTRENVVVLDFLAVDNFDFTRKIAKKNLVEKLVKMFLAQKFKFFINFTWFFGHKKWLSALVCTVLWRSISFSKTTEYFRLTANCILELSKNIMKVTTKVVLKSYQCYPTYYPSTR